MSGDEDHGENINTPGGGIAQFDACKSASILNILLYVPEDWEVQ